MKRLTSAQELTITQVCEAFSTWRKTRAKRGRIPDYLLEQVSQLKNIAHTKIAKSLGLDSKLVKSIFAKKSAGILEPVALKTPTFIALPPLTSSDKINCILSRTDGAQLKLELLEHQSLMIVEQFLCCK